MTKEKILQNLKSTEENWNSHTTYEIVNEMLYLYLNGKEVL